MLDWLCVDRKRIDGVMIDEGYCIVYVSHCVDNITNFESHPKRVTFSSETQKRHRHTLFQRKNITLVLLGSSLNFRQIATRPSSDGEPRNVAFRSHRKVMHVERTIQLKHTDHR